MPDFQNEPANDSPIPSEQHEIRRITLSFRCDEEWDEDDIIDELANHKWIGFGGVCKILKEDRVLGDELMTVTALISVPVRSYITDEEVIKTFNNAEFISSRPVTDEEWDWMEVYYADWDCLDYKKRQSEREMKNAS